RFHVGQNVALTWTYEYEDNLLDEPDWDSQIYAWYDECTQFNFKASAISPFQFSKKLGHFTQKFEQELRKMAPRAETDEECRLLSPSALVVCFCTDAELTPEPVQDFEELGLNSFRTGMNRTRQCSGRTTSG
ncbi:venom allergen 3, partial [Ixodes scapularis]